MSVIFRPSVLAFAVLSLSSCMVFGGGADQAVRRTPSYRAGYADGCAAANNGSANYRDGPNADDGLYDTDTVYRRGWANGYQTCRTTTPGPGDSPLANQGIGNPGR